MNILLVNHYAGGPSLGMEYRSYYLAREWARAGHGVTVIAASCSHLRQRDPATRGPVTVELLEGVRYIWLRTPAYRGNGVGRVQNIFHFVGRLYASTRTFAAFAKPDVVIASSTYTLDAFPASRMARLWGATLIFEVRDLWPLTLIELGGMSRWHPFVALVQRGEDHACRSADRVVSVLPRADLHLIERGMKPEKFAYVPNGIDVQEWRRDQVPMPREHQQLIEKLRCEGRFLVGYAGQHSVSNALDTMVDAAARLQGTPVTFVCVGQGPEKDRLVRRVRDGGNANVRFLPAIGKATVPAFLESMDALYLGWKRSPLYRFGISPNKLFDYMMAAKPVIHAVDAANDLVTESGCGISCPPEDPAALAAAVQQMQSLSRSARIALGQQGHEYVVAKHDYRVLASRFLDAVV